MASSIGPGRSARARRLIFAGVMGAAAVVLGLGLALVSGTFRDAGETARSPAGATASASSSPAPSTTTDVVLTPTPIPSVGPTSVPTPPTAMGADERLVFSVAPWYDIISPVTLSLTEDGRLVELWATGREGFSTGGDGSLLLTERWLSPLGIALVREEIIATGLFAVSAEYWPIPLPGHELPGRGNSGYQVELRDSGLEVKVTWSTIDSDEPEWAEPSPERERLTVLGDRLMSLESWLPADAWVDASERPFIPNRYRLFLSSGPWGCDLDALPPDVSSIAWPFGGSLLEYGEELPNSNPEYAARCAVLGRADAEAAVRALEEAGAVMGSPLDERHATGTTLGDRSTGRFLDVIFEALAPHETDCTEAWPPNWW